MKKAIFGIMILALIFASSCKKNTANGPVTSGNSWTFEGTTYKTTHCSVTTYLEAYSDTPVYYGTIQVNFPHNVIPTINGTYTVVNDQIYTLAPNQVNIGMTIGGLSGINYYSSGGNGSNQKVQVTVSGGKITVSGSGIELFNPANPSDSSALTINVTQNQ